MDKFEMAAEIQRLRKENDRLRAEMAALRIRLAAQEHLVNIYQPDSEAYQQRRRAIAP